MNDENVRKILVKQGVKLRLPHVTNPAYFRTGSDLTPVQLLQEIKRLYVDEKLPARHIADQLAIDESAVRTKLRALGVKIEVRKVFKAQIVVAPNRNIKGIFLGTSEPYMVFHIPAKTVTYEGHSLDKRKTGVCQWCASQFPQYIDKGPRTQKFCCHRCSDRAKDFRRLLKASKQSQSRFEALDGQLRNAWGNKYDEARNRTLSVQPIINTEAV